MAFLRAIFSVRPLDVDTGVLVLRVGVGLSMMLFHGWGKITGGPALWTSLGANMQHLGISFVPVAWGFLAAVAEFFASLFLILGVAVRPAAAMLAFTMLVAAARHLSLPADNPSAGWRGASHAIELLVAYAALLLTGSGRYALARLWTKESS